VTQPARIQALSQRHLDLSDLPVMEFSSLTQLPSKVPPLVPETGFATVKAIAPEVKPLKPLQAEEGAMFAVINTGT